MISADGPAGMEDVAQAAAGWVLRLSRDDVGEGDWLAFTAWLDGGPPDQPQLHRTAFDRAQAIWLDLDRVAGTRAPDARPPYRRRPSAVRPKMQALWPAASAAAALLLALCGAWLLTTPHAEQRRQTPQPMTFATAAGQTRALTLPDGTRITLDGATILSVEVFGAHARAVALQRGEAMFDVVHDPARPFRVDLGPARIQVLGTAFDVVREPGATRVSVSRGAVRFAAGDEEVRVTVGQSGELAAGRIELRAVAPNGVGGWRDGRRLYVDRPLAEVVADLDRGMVQPIRLGDASARRMRFTGVLVLGPREAMVRRLTALLPLKARPGTDGAIVLGSRGS